VFDAIVIGSGMSGGIAAKELCERGLKTLVLERGRKLEHGASYTDAVLPWELNNANMIPDEELERDYPIQRRTYALSDLTRQYWVKDREHPYSMPEDKPFGWFRGNHLAGRSIMWGRQTYRLSEMDFEANAKDGHGVDWPIRYADLAPWYDHVERFIGVSGSKEGLAQLPDGQFLPAFGLNDAEKDFAAKVATAFPGRKVIPGRCAHLSEPQPHHEELGRMKCQVRSLCERGCTYGAYHSSLSSSLPAAERTGNLTVITDAVVHSIVHDPRTGKATGVRVIDANTKEGRTYEAKVIFVCASTIGTTQILLNSKSDAFQNGLGNSHDVLGRYLTDHLGVGGAVAYYPGLTESFYRGRRPTGFYVPRFRNVTEPADFVRGFGYQGGAGRRSWKRLDAGIGAPFKEKMRTPGPWLIFLAAFGEMLPNRDNRITLHPTKTDAFGIPQAHIECVHGENDMKMAKAMVEDAKAMIQAAGGRVVKSGGELGTPGDSIHEMGTACMGKDPSTSVLNKYNQLHDVANLFVTDGAAMSSGGCQNPSLTYMALSARAAHHAAEFLKAGQI
jgi:choline dehydrogenase-like flavoprotein